MVIRQLVAAMVLAWATLPPTVARAQNTTPGPAPEAEEVSFVTPEGLFVIQPLGRERQTLLNGDDGPINSLAWSADGQQLGVVKDYNHVLRLNPADNRSTRVFTSECPRLANLELAWQADHQTLVIQQRCTTTDADDQGQWAMFLVDAKGQLTSLPTLPQAPESALYLSPNGRQVAYVANQHIYVAPLDGSEPQRLTQQPGVYSSAGSPLTWSPDGTRLAFYEGTYPFQRIHVIEVNSGDRQLLTPEDNFQIYRSRLFWSPNGQYLAFYQPANPPLSNQEVISLVEVASGERRVLTRPGFYNALSWAPDSQSLAFAAGSQWEQQALFVLALDSQDFTALTPQPFQTILESRWAPAGDWIAFTASSQGDDLGTQTLYVVRPDATQLTALTSPREYAFPFAWVPAP